LPVVGTDKSVEAPPGVCGFASAVPRDLAVPRTTLAGLTGLSELFVRRSGAIGSPPPPRRLYDHEVFRRPTVPCGPKTARPAPAGFVSLSGFGPMRPLRSCLIGSPLLGFHAPSATSAGGSLPRTSRSATVRPRGFSPPRRVDLPPALRARWARCRSWGSRSQDSFDREGRCVPAHRCAEPHLRPLIHGALQPRTLRNTK
jgi:hypothetical protein